jgi:hypothetical protein
MRSLHTTLRMSKHPCAGEALMTAALTVFVLRAQTKGTSVGADFAAAREVLITHFAEVDKLNSTWLLETFGEYLEDERIVPALKQIPEMPRTPGPNRERMAVLKQLERLLRITIESARNKGKQA